MSEWLNADETADYLSISLSNLYSLAQQGRIPGHRIGKMWRFNKTDLDAWIKANRPINEFFTSVEASIELNDLLRDPQREGYSAAHNFFEAKGEKAIITDTECVLKKDDELPESCIQGAKALYIGDCFMPVAEKAVRLAQKMGITSFLRVKNVHAPFGEDLEKVMNNADYVIMNEKTSALIKRSESTIITRGKKGCQCGDIIVKGIPITSRDTTGAGDAFCAGFMYQIVKGSPLEKALKFGNAAAAVSTTVYGAMDSMPSREAVESLLYMV